MIDLVDPCLHTVCAIEWDTDCTATKVRNVCCVICGDRFMAYSIFLRESPVSEYQDLGVVYKHDHISPAIDAIREWRARAKLAQSPIVNSKDNLI